MSESKVTIIVPAYNISNYIGECLDSILLQTHSSWSCFVVDDGSTDDTAQKVAGFTDARIRLIQQENAGVSAARNRGLAEAAVEYVMFLDGDDLLHPEALARLVAGLIQKPDAVASFGSLIKILPNGAAYPGQKPLDRHRYPYGDVLEALLKENFLANGGHVLVRRAAAQKIGGFNTTLALSEDWEFWCRLATLGNFVFIGNKPEVFYLRVRPTSASGGLSVKWNNHEKCLAVLQANPKIKSRFTPERWNQLCCSMRASQLWEAGRVNFTMRHFRDARQLMLRSLRLHPNAKRLILFGLAQVSQLTNRPIVSRLRFQNSDIQENERYRKIL